MPQDYAREIHGIRVRPRAHLAISAWFTHGADGRIVPRPATSIALSISEGKDARRGLSAILHGDVSERWARHHHPLWLADRPGVSTDDVRSPH